MEGKALLINWVWQWDGPRGFYHLSWIMESVVYAFVESQRHIKRIITVRND